MNGQRKSKRIAISTISKLPRITKLPLEIIHMIILEASTSLERILSLINTSSIFLQAYCWKSQMIIARGLALRDQTYDDARALIDVQNFNSSNQSSKALKGKTFGTNKSTTAIQTLEDICKNAKAVSDGCITFFNPSKSRKSCILKYPFGRARAKPLIYASAPLERARFCSVYYRLWTILEASKRPITRKAFIRTETLVDTPKKLWIELEDNYFTGPMERLEPGPWLGDPVLDIMWFVHDGRDRFRRLDRQCGGGSTTSSDDEEEDTEFPRWDPVMLALYDVLGDFLKSIAGGFSNRALDERHVKASLGF